MNLPATLQSFWAERAARERRFLVAGGVVLALLLLYFLFIDPAASGVARLERGLPQARARAAELEAILAEARSLRQLPASATPATGDARAALIKSLGDSGLAPAHTEPLPSGDLRLSFSNVPYGKWVSWLAGAEQTLGVHAVSVHAKANGAPGNADIELAVRMPRS
jgi:general secretion pathway protein M